STIDLREIMQRIELCRSKPALALERVIVDEAGPVDAGRELGRTEDRVVRANAEVVARVMHEAVAQRCWGPPCRAPVGTTWRGVASTVEGINRDRNAGFTGLAAAEAVDRIVQRASR